MQPNTMKKGSPAIKKLSKNKNSLPYNRYLGSPGNLIVNVCIRKSQKYSIKEIKLSTLMVF